MSSPPPVALQVGTAACTCVKRGTGPSLQLEIEGGDTGVDCGILCTDSSLPVSASVPFEEAVSAERPTLPSDGSMGSAPSAASLVVWPRPLGPDGCWPEPSVTVGSTGAACVTAGPTASGSRAVAGIAAALAAHDVRSCGSASARVATRDPMFSILPQAVLWNFDVFIAACISIVIWIIIVVVNFLIISTCYLANLAINFSM